MSSMESFIIVISLIASAAGALILLTSLAGKKAQLAKAFSMQMEMEAQERSLQASTNYNSPDNRSKETIEPVKGN